jgi:hypothetical protein
MDERPRRLDEASVEAMVGNAHGDLDEVRRLLDAEASLANAAWDWGAGDWETALGAAAHMGRRDIAELLVDHGARIDVFAAAMLGRTQVVRAMLDAFPHLVDAKGPHGIPLKAHAVAGGRDAAEVVALLDERSAAHTAA